jgi:hypothetical protein
MKRNRSLDLAMSKDFYVTLFDNPKIFIIELCAFLLSPNNVTRSSGHIIVQTSVTYLGIIQGPICL